MMRLAFCILIFSFEAFAYIPSTSFVFDRVASQHGKGQYMLEQELTFQQGIDKITVRENWLINDGGEMRVWATADNLRLFRLLKRGRIYWIENGTEHADEVSPDFFMNALLTRTPAEEKKFFIRWNALTTESLREKRLPKDVADIKYDPENRVRLGRVAGAIMYSYGDPAPVTGAPTPGVWIEQDGFVIRKMRSPTGAEIYANDYVNYSKGLSFPRTQVITFGNHVVNVRVTRVVSLEFNADQKRQLDPSWIRNRPDAGAVWPKTPLASVIQEFYKRFR